MSRLQQPAWWDEKIPQNALRPWVVATRAGKVPKYAGTFAAAGKAGVYSGCPKPDDPQLHPQKTDKTKNAFDAKLRRRKRFLLRKKPESPGFHPKVTRL